MKIVICCPYFPPESEISAIRIGKFAEYWAKAGHEVIVITRIAVSSGTHFPRNTNLSVIRVKDPLGFAHTYYKTEKAEFLHSKNGFNLVQTVKKILLFPDQFVFWAIKAYVETRRSLNDIDIVFASGSPISAFVLGKFIAKKYSSKFVVDYRDLLSTKPTINNKIRQRLSFFIEKSAVNHSDLISVASPGCAENLSKFFTKPIVVIENGFEPDDFKELNHKASNVELTIVYTGSIYRDDSDLRPLLNEIRKLIDSNNQWTINIDFYGLPASWSVLKTWAEETGTSDYIINNGIVPHSEVVKAQVNADLLLLLLPVDKPENHWVMSGKFYEYLGAKRPILQIGLESGEIGKRLREYSLGLASSDTNEISEFLKSSIHQKIEQGYINSHNSSYLLKHTREVQSMKLLKEIHSVFLLGDS
jgi:hypothetical protein